MARSSARDSGKLRSATAEYPGGMALHSLYHGNLARSVAVVAAVMACLGLGNRVFVDDTAPVSQLPSTSRSLTTGTAAEMEKAAEAEKAAAARMKHKISIEVKEGPRLEEFLNTLSFVTGIKFSIAESSDIPVVAKFEDRPLNEILDAVLPPNGLTWTREGNLVTIVAADLSSRESDTSQTANQTETLARLDQKVSLEVREGTRLRPFLTALASMAQLDYVIIQNADTKLGADWQQKRVRDVLDTALKPNALAWRFEHDTLVVSWDLHSRAFRLNSDALLIVHRLFETKELHRILWNAETPPTARHRLTLDEREALLLLTDSKENVARMAEFLGALERKTPPRLITRIYSVRKDLAQSIKLHVETLLSSNKEPPPYAPETAVILAEREERADLIVRDTEDNIRKVEALLSDPDFVNSLRLTPLDIYTVNLTPRSLSTRPTVNRTPRGVSTRPNELLEAFTRDVKEIIETMLYRWEGVGAAQDRGRRMWFDPTTGRMTIMDTSDSLRWVAGFLESVPGLGLRVCSETISLQHAKASDPAHLAELKRWITQLDAPMSRTEPLHDSSPSALPKKQ